jgi:hypothetical protein
MHMNTKNPKCTPLLRGSLLRLVHPGRIFIPSEDPTKVMRKFEAIISVWCPFCREQHLHGWDPGYGSTHAEHRTAHCSNAESPFKETGYYISVWRKKDPEYASHVIAPGTPVIRAVSDAEIQRLATKTLKL